MKLVRKKLAITIGDPAGIGPEVALKALLSEEISRICLPVLVGDAVVIRKASRLIKGKRTFPRGVKIVDLGQIRKEDFARGKPTAAGGKASAAYIREAVNLAINGEVDAIITAPISKEALKRGGFPWPGHTEMLAELTGTKEYAMMLVGGPLRVILVTIHTALKNVPKLVTKERVLRTIRLARRACHMMGIKTPKIAVSGLNPHAGESGIFGTEEIKEIVPAVNEAREERINAEGPFPPDTIFHKAYRREVDIVVCMYHDQGLIPLKMIAFDKGVNVTVGLPIIRTSPDHGTAYDIAWKGDANPSSMIEAIKLATMLRRF